MNTFFFEGYAFMNIESICVKAYYQCGIISIFTTLTAATHYAFM